MAAMTKPEPPYYVAIFTVEATGDDTAEYATMDGELNRLVANHHGYLGAERSMDAQGRAISLLYFTDDESIQAWRDHPIHRDAQRQGVRNTNGVSGKFG